MFTNSVKSNCSILIVLTFMIFYTKLSLAAGVWSTTQSVITLPNSIKMKSNVSAGTILWTSPPVTSGLKDGEDASIRAKMYMEIRGVNGSSADGKTYPTTFPGIGVRFRGSLNSAKVNGVTAYAANPPSYNTVNWTANASTEYTQTVYLELVSTSNYIGQGELNLNGINMLMLFNCPNSTCINDWTITVTGKTQVLGISCSVDNYTPSVDFGTIYTQRMKRIGDTYNEKNLSIHLSCNDNSLQPKITFNGVANEGNELYFKLNGAATGIAMKLSYPSTSTSILPNKTISLSKPVSLASINYIFSAAIVQTAQKVGPGDFETTITFVIDYSEI